MTVLCDECGKPIDRRTRAQNNFCCVEHRNRWMSRNVDYGALSRCHKAKHLTELNEQRNKLCSIADRGRSNSKRSRKTAEEYLNRPLHKGEVVHHINGDATEDRYENLLIMTDREHKQLHMVLAMDQMEGGDGDDK
jgi:hypothetical protein